MNIVENWQAKLIPLDLWSFLLQNDNTILILFVVMGLDPQLHIPAYWGNVIYGHGVGHHTLGSSQTNFDVCGLIWHGCLLSGAATWTYHSLIVSRVWDLSLRQYGSITRRQSNSSSTVFLYPSHPDLAQCWALAAINPCPLDLITHCPTIYLWPSSLVDKNI